MVTKWLITIYLENEHGEVDSVVFEENTLLEASRYIFNYDGKRGWSPFKYDIERVYGLC